MDIESLIIGILVITAMGFFLRSFFRSPRSRRWSRRGGRYDRSASDGGVTHPSSTRDDRDRDESWTATDWSDGGSGGDGGGD
jgi:hypothetical protein